MDHHYYIKLIVEQMFNKIKLTSTADSVTGWTNDIELQSDPKNRINYKTAERAHKKYIENDDSIGKFKKKSIDNFCKFLDYEDYKDYVEKIQKNKPEINKPKFEDELIPEEKENDLEDVEDLEDLEDDKNKKWKYVIAIILSSLTIFFIYDYISKPEVKKENKSTIECMAWAQDHYEKVDCNLQLHPKYGTKVEPYKAYLEKSMQKLDNDTIDASATFFSEETGNPLVWYYKTNEGMLEYFTAPGLHPVNGKTLKKITEGMIEKYVPIHRTQSDSFISDAEVNSVKTELAILILNENKYDSQLVSHVKASLFDKNNSITRLTDTTTYQKGFIYNFSPDKKLYLNHNLIIADTLVLGLSKYKYSNNLDIDNMITCNLILELSLFVQDDNKWKEITSRNINSIGSGYTEIEAKTNALKKIDYD